MYKLADLVVPEKLNRGDKVVAITLSWGGAGEFLDRFEMGKKRLEESFGVEVVPSRHALRSAEWIYNNPEARAQDLMEAFSDKQVKAIISNIGGDDSIRLIPFVNLDVITNNPKVFLGYSDTTVSHFMCLKAGIRSFYGPALMTAFAENVSPHEYSMRGIKANLFTTDILGNIPNNSEGWTTEFLDWSDPKNQSRKRILKPATGWNFIGSKDVVSGRLIGGCLEALQFLNGSELWPDNTIWDDSILFLETSEEGMEPPVVTRFLRNLAAQGILQRVKGILFSKPGGKNIIFERFAEYDNAILKVFKEYGIGIIPIATWMDFGHSDPMWTLQYGALAEINAIEKSVSILESTVGANTL